MCYFLLLYIIINFFVIRNFFKRNSKIVVCLALSYLNLMITHCGRIFHYEFFITFLVFCMTRIFYSSKLKMSHSLVKHLLSNVLLNVADPLSLGKWELWRIFSLLLLSKAKWAIALTYLRYWVVPVPNLFPLGPPVSHYECIPFAMSFRTRTRHMIHLFCMLFEILNVRVTKTSQQKRFLKSGFWIIFLRRH